MGYRETLHKWAAKYIPEGAKVDWVDLEYDEGYRYSSYTFEDPHVRFSVYYIESDGTQGIYWGDKDQLPTMGVLLTELFAIEDGEAT